MEYVPPVNGIVSTPVHTLTSSRPAVMLPLPSAVNVPARPKKLPCPEHSSVPVMEKAYCPAKLALENFAPGGGGGGGGGPGFDPPPPHAVVNNTKASETSRASRFIRVFIAARPAVHSACAQLAATRGWRSSLEEIRAASAPPRLACPFARCEPETRCSHLRKYSHQQTSRSRLLREKSDCCEDSWRDQDVHPRGLWQFVR